MTLHLITVCHNTDRGFLPYEPGHALTRVISHWRHLPTATDPEQSADWAYQVFNSDLEHLETGRAAAEAEADFLIVCIYRLLRLRSLATGDAITIEGHTTWLACERVSWRRIDTPANLTGQSLSASTVYEHLRRGHHA